MKYPNQKSSSKPIIAKKVQCVKSVRIRSYSGPYFPAVGLNTKRIQENTDQNNSKYGHFLRSGF